MPRHRHTVAQACRTLGITEQATRWTVESGTVCYTMGGASARGTLATTLQPDSSPSGTGIAATRSWNDRAPAVCI